MKFNSNLMQLILGFFCSRHLLFFLF